MTPLDTKLMQRALQHALTRCQMICQNLNTNTKGEERGTDCARQIEAQAQAIIDEAVAVAEAAVGTGESDAASDLHTHRLDTYPPVMHTRTMVAKHYGADYVESLLRTDRLVRHYVNGLLGNNKDATIKATQEMVDYVMLKSPVSLSVLAHAADCDLLKPTVIEAANSTRYVARNCTCGALERSQAEPKTINKHDSRDYDEPF